MAILKPSNISPNNVAKDATEQIVISWKDLGDRHYYYQVVFYKADDNMLVFDSGKRNDLNPFFVVSANTLTNGATYKYQITVWNEKNESVASDWVILKCSSVPNCSLINLTPHQEILNSSYSIQGQYNQDENVPIKSWSIILYDVYDSIIATSGIVYDDTIEYRIEGLNSNNKYKAELQVRSQDDLWNTTGKIEFLVRYEVPETTVALKAENVPDKAAVSLSWRVTQIIGNIIEGTIEYKDGEKVDLRNGAIAFTDGLPSFREFNLKLWLEWVDLKNIVITKQVPTCLGIIDWNVRDGTTEILRMKTSLGDIWLEWEYEDDLKGRFYLKKNMYGVPYHVKTDLLQFTQGDVVYIGISYDGGLCDIHVQKG